MKHDLPPGFDALFDKFQKPPDKPEAPKKGMTTEELIRNMEHNARLIKPERV